MRIHILGICGTFMSGVAVLAKQAGHVVTGSDTNVYPPMSTQLEKQGIILQEGYDPSHIDQNVDCVVVGNVIKRGNPAMEYVMEHRIPYLSGPEWLAENILRDRWVLAVSGTHGKTTTTSMLAWLLEYAGSDPGFLIGGVPENFGISARLGSAPYFVIEADEYDSAFFDKRSKFLHYRPNTLILNNLEYDHADIFPSLDAIKQQFHFLIRTVPASGLIVRHAGDAHLMDVMKMGVWTKEVTFGAGGSLQAKLLKADGSEFAVMKEGQEAGQVSWGLLGVHNVENALAAMAAAEHATVPLDKAIQALTQFKNVKRRLEIKGQINNVVVYDDFAHHPTAIATTLAGLRAKIGKDARIIAVLEFGSYTMRAGVHKERIQESLNSADLIVCKSTYPDWGLKEILGHCKQPTAMYDNVEEIISYLGPQLQSGDHVVVMSNAGFGGIHQKLINTLKQLQEGSV